MDGFLFLEGKKGSGGSVCNPKPLPGWAASTLQLLRRGGEANKGRSSHNFATFVTAALYKANVVLYQVGLSTLPSLLTQPPVKGQG